MSDLNRINPDMHPDGLRWSFRTEEGRMPQSPHGDGIGWHRDKERVRRLALPGSVLIGYDETGAEVTREEMD